MLIRTATVNDIKILREYDKHIDGQELENSVRQNHIYVVEEQKELIGWLRYNLFWDSIPFMNMLYLLDAYRGKGIGKQLVEYWENQMKDLNYKMVMTSTQSNEYAQHFYNKLGYKTIGGFLLKNDPFELILSKEL